MKEIRENEIAESNEIIQLITRAYNDTCKSVISRLFQGIAKSRDNTTTYIKERWERELNDKITCEQWDNMCDAVFSTSCSMYWREFCWKNLVRFFVTPKMKTYSITTVQTCWRKCGKDEANHYHIFWSCPGLRPFWDNIVKTIPRILGQQIPLPFTTLYLGDLPDGMAENDRYLLKIMSAAAKKSNHSQLTSKSFC